MKWLITGARVLLGLVFVVFGSDYFLHFMPETPISKQGGAFLDALLATGYLFPLIKAIEIVSGILLLTGRYAALGAALLSPIALNIVCYHAFLDPNGRAIGFSAGALEVVLLIAYRRAYRCLFQPPEPVRVEFRERVTSIGVVAGVK